MKVCLDTFPLSFLCGFVCPRDLLLLLAGLPQQCAAKRFWHSDVEYRERQTIIK